MFKDGDSSLEWAGFFVLLQVLKVILVSYVIEECGEAENVTWGCAWNQ